MTKNNGQDVLTPYRTDKQRINKLERDIEFLKDKIAFLNGQIDRQTKINDGFIKLLENYIK